MNLLGGYSWRIKWGDEWGDKTYSSSKSYRTELSATKAADKFIRETFLNKDTFDIDLEMAILNKYGDVISTWKGSLEGFLEAILRDS